MGEWGVEQKWGLSLAICNIFCMMIPDILCILYPRPEVQPQMSGGGLGHKYRLAQVTFHWGDSARQGYDMICMMNTISL